MNMIKILGLIIAMVVMFTASAARADFTIELKNESDVVLKTYTITYNQVAHLQKKATRTGISVITQFEDAIKNLILNAKSANAVTWRRNNEAFIEEQSRQ